jgi:hypothetical protein
MIVPLVAPVGCSMPTLMWLALTPDDVVAIEQTAVQQYECGCTACSV